MRGTKPDDDDDRRQVTLLLLIGILAAWAGVATVIVAACVLGARADREMRRSSPMIISHAPVAGAAHGRVQRSRLARI